MIWGAWTWRCCQTLWTICWAWCLYWTSDLGGFISRRSFALVRLRLMVTRLSCFFFHKCRHVDWKDLGDIDGPEISFNAAGRVSHVSGQWKTAYGFLWQSPASFLLSSGQNWPIKFVNVQHQQRARDVQIMQHWVGLSVAWDFSLILGLTELRDEALFIRGRNNMEVDWPRSSGSRLMRWKAPGWKRLLIDE